MHGAAKRRPRVRLALVLTLSALVHAPAMETASAVAQGRSPPVKSKPSAHPPKPQPADGVLPRAVTEMVDAIQTAVSADRIEDLNDAVDWNEMKPDLGPGLVSDPVAYWKSISKDGDGRDILDVLGKLLAGKPAVRPLGKDLENNRLYVWPAFADTPISKLSPAEAAALAALVSPDALGPMQDKNRYTGWRLVLGADGVWHSFRQD